MKRPVSHQIDEQAQQFLKRTLPLDWAIVEQRPDYGKDYMIETGTKGRLTGNVFFVQLKGMQSAKTRNPAQDWAFSLKSKHAKYYVDSVKDLPVFLVVVDVTQQKARWLFLQEALEKNQNWRKQTSTTLYLPAQNELGNTPLLIEAVTEAKKWMRLRHPASVVECIEAERQRIVRIDPRFDPKISFQNGELHCAMHTTEKLTLKVQTLRDHEKVNNKLEELIDKGTAVQFEPGEIKILGSRLFDPVETTGVIIQTQLSRPCTVRITCIDDADSTGKESLEFVRSLTGGRKEMWFNGQFSSSPLVLKMGPFFESSLTLSLSLKFEQWEGRALLFLPYFDQLRTFFNALKRTGKTKSEISSEGNVIVAGSGNLNSQPIVAWFCGFLEALDKARKIAKHFQVNPIWSLEKCDIASLRSICRLYEVQFGGGWSEPAPNASLKAELYPDPQTPALLARSQVTPADIHITHYDEICFFGETIQTGKTVRQLTNMRMLPQTTGKRRARKASIDGSAVKKINVVMTGNESTELIVRRATESE